VSLTGVGLLAVDSARTRAYLSAMLAADLAPAEVLLLAGGGGGEDVPYFDNRTPVVTHLHTHGIPCLSLGSSDPNAPEAVEAVRASRLSLLVYSGPPGVILGAEMLRAGKPLLHVHPGILPRYRGSTTIYYSLLAEGRCGATAFFLAPEIDAGPVIATALYPPPEDRRHIDRGYDPYIRSELLVRVLQTYRDGGSLEGRPQATEGPMMHYIIHPVLKHLAILGGGGFPVEPCGSRGARSEGERACES
jgi:methionyl-tRNA formyltransferase